MERFSFLPERVFCDRLYSPDKHLDRVALLVTVSIFGECPQMYLNAASLDRDPRTQRLLTE